MNEQNEKQAIEEMAKDLQETHDYEGCEAWHCSGCQYEEYGENYFCSSIKQAEKMTAKGYSKQEWISVDERLPERMKTVLVCIKGYRKNPIMVVSEMLEENGARWSACAGFTVTHWMPLPEPPKGE